MTETTLPGLEPIALRRFLEDRGCAVAGPLRASALSGGKSNLTYRVTDGETVWVVRRPPTAGLTPSAHDVGREFRVTSALRDTGVPVAAAIALCEDDSVMGAPFTVVEWVEGRVVRTADELDGLGEVDDVVTELVGVLARLHAVDHEAVGLADFGRPNGYLERQVALWARQWQHVKAAESADVDRLHARLAASIPARSGAAIVHGDYRIDNTILSTADPARVAAVVDWELSTLGDPLADVALMCVYRNPALDTVLGDRAAWTSDRLPDGDALAHRYSEASGRDIHDWDFHLGLANFKMAVIAQGIDHRHRAGAAGDGLDTAGSAVPRFVAAGLDAVG
ncbi:phosphotransferase family protein [Rhodococcus rhodnii]|uniref:Phosphotransferase n=2 Tax=Rhodococcus rhodnii TaxID=38312 RepID=R7WP05_9NOCA|nr:phosphotransferase family protein [Rhodococcus rhodnii]EOM77005.1 phosphotransferase [Rhodococcus rhodnii LMG 5362]TXG89918.1 phosphotransferase family protein [Rhodococcus rhodnii]